MATRILGPTGGRRRRRFLLGPILLVSLAALFLVAGAQAVHDTGAFELEGNAVTDHGAGPPDDWDRVCHEVLGTDCSTTADTSGATAVSWQNDGAQNASIFTTGGSKDPQDISSWQWKDQLGGLPDKDNLQDAFAARYSLPATLPTDPNPCPNGTDPATGTCEVIYFGSDRFDNSGDAQQGFWFLQGRVCLSGVGTCPNTHPDRFVDAETGNLAVHTVGDLLVLTDFSNGGGTSTIRVFEWVGSGGDTNDTLQSLPGGGPNKTCGAATSDPFCGIVNPIDGTTAPWPFTDKSGNHTYLQGEFFEGGINLSLLPGGLASECFATFLSESRSSTSPTATLKDFVLGSFAPCGSETETTPLDGNGDPISGHLSIGTGSVTVKDRAEVTVSGTSTFDGNVTFHLCFISQDPDADPTTAGTCDGTTNVGTQIGSAQTIGPPSPVTVTSDPATITSIGLYCWRANYSGDAANGVPPSSDSRPSECFSVDPKQPMLTTEATPTVVFPGALDDIAHLTGTASQPGDPIINGPLGAAANGTITFTLHGPSPTPDCTTAIATRVVNVSGDGDYTASSGTGSGSLDNLTPGTYYWIAVYSGDSPNTLGASTSCGDLGEQGTVTDTTAVVTEQNWLPNDKATITSGGGSALDGSVTFTLFDSANCTGTELYSEGPITVSGSSPQEKNTNNTTVKVSVSKTVSWRSVYTSNNPDVSGSESNCETTVLTITN